ncbi:MAG: tetratricopeptide repeat protein [Acidobacteria bacterium]|nr:tetratricopeptide repeat protein [Acidobacteriota bacterium]
MQKIIVWTCAALVVSASVPPAAAAQNREHQQMAADARMLQEQTQQLAVTLGALNTALADALEALYARMDQVAEATRQTAADHKVAIDSVAEGVRIMRERSNDTNVRMGELREELEALRSTVQALQQATMAPPLPLDPDAPLDPNAPGALPALPAAPPLSSTAGLSPTRLYETARADYFAGQWTSAINGFDAFLRAFPRSEQSDEAQFHIGETHYAQNAWAAAIAAYNQVILNYPGTNAVPDALYKRGLAEEHLGEMEAARISWETVSENFPDSDAGRLARQNLDRLGGTP